MRRGVRRRSAGRSIGRWPSACRHVGGVVGVVVAGADRWVVPWNWVRPSGSAMLSSAARCGATGVPGARGGEVVGCGGRWAARWSARRGEVVDVEWGRAARRSRREIIGGMAASHTRWGRGGGEVWGACVMLSWLAELERALGARRVVLVIALPDTAMGADQRSEWLADGCDNEVKLLIVRLRR